MAFESEMAMITSKLSKEEAIERLRILLANASESRSLSGEVTNSSVAVRRAQRFGDSIFRPQFSGTIESTAAGCMLMGDFRLARTAKVVLQAWFVFAGIWTMLTVVVAAKSEQPYSWVLPLGGVVLLTCGVLFMQFAKWYYRSDGEWLLRILSEELNGKCVPAEG